MKSKSIGTFLFYAGSLATFAAELAPPTVEARLKIIALREPIVGVGFIQGKKPTGIAIGTDIFTEEIAYHGSARFELIPGTITVKPDTPIPSEDSDAASATPQVNRGITNRGQPREFTSSDKPPLAWIDLPTDRGTLHLLLLVNPGMDNGIKAIPDPPGAFPLGTTRYFNLCPMKISVRTPSGTQSIDPNSSKVIRSGGKPYDYFSLEIFQPTNTGESPLFSGRIFQSEEVRKLYLIKPRVNGNGISIKVIEDRMLTPSKPTVQRIESGPGKK